MRSANDPWRHIRFSVGKPCLISNEHTSNNCWFPAGVHPQRIWCWVQGLAIRGQNFGIFECLAITNHSCRCKMLTNFQFTLSWNWLKTWKCQVRVATFWLFIGIPCASVLIVKHLYTYAKKLMFELLKSPCASSFIHMKCVIFVNFSR